MEGQAYYTIPQLAERCGIPKSALYAAARRGDLKTAMPKGCERLTLVKSWRMMAQKENAPKVGSQAGAAQKSTDDSTTFADDARFAARALGVGELLAPLSELRDPRTLLAFLGAWLVIVGMFLTLALIG